jgi:hypothetical protein
MVLNNLGEDRVGTVLLSLPHLSFLVPFVRSSHLPPPPQPPPPLVSPSIAGQFSEVHEILRLLRMRIVSLCAIS